MTDGLDARNDRICETKHLSKPPIRQSRSCLVNDKMQQSKAGKMMTRGRSMQTVHQVN